MSAFELWYVVAVLCVVGLILFLGCRRPGWRDLIALRLVLSSYVIIVIQGTMQGAMLVGGTRNADLLLSLLFLILWLWGGVRALVCRSSRYRKLAFICWGILLLLGAVGAGA